jgi:glucosamine--fructose-6-phosphate aminotransferase (isomerizing)
MCGIIGYVWSRSVAPLLLTGLVNLEYRGYDSAGIAVLDPDNRIQIRKTAGKVKNLVDLIDSNMPEGVVGIAHTRWATHGAPNDFNSHPHLDCSQSLAVVHNGIVENYQELKESLLRQGHRFSSETDSEIIAHLIEKNMQSGLGFVDATREAALQLIGASAVVAMSVDEPSVIVTFRLGNAGGITVGYSNEGMLVASDLTAVLPSTNRVVFLGPGELARIDHKGASYSSLGGDRVVRKAKEISVGTEAATKGSYEHFMLKEIMEQPEAITRTLGGRVSFDPPGVMLEDIGLTTREIAKVDRIVLVGMGTSWQAAQAGRYMMERLAGLPADVDNSSEFGYRNAPLGKHTLLVSVAQSGETVDTLNAMEEAARKGVKQITICNVEGSQSTRIADGTILIRVGPEISVASTKSLTGSIAALYMLATYIGKERGFLQGDLLSSVLEDLATIPRLLGEALEQRECIQELAKTYYKYKHFLFLGRGMNTSTAMEGALKLKEVSYIHAEGYAAGEMKHGPIALIDNKMPVVAIVPRNYLYSKMMSNIEEIKARDGIVIAVGTKGDELLRRKVDHVIEIPETPQLLTPAVAVVPLQLLAYHIALLKGCDVDQPRNLAKTVTVE